MRLTRATVYALRALVHMAEHKDHPLLASHTIARAEGIPERFLLKVLRPLVNCRVVDSLKGPNGGYRLAKAAHDVSLLEVVEAVEGPVRGQALAAGGEAGAALDRRLKTVLDRVNDSVRADLARVSLADLAGKRKGPLSRVG